MVIELSGVQFWSEIIRVISKSNERAARVRFEITSMISDQIALHSVQLPLLTQLIKPNIRFIGLVMSLGFCFMLRKLCEWMRLSRSNGASQYSDYRIGRGALLKQEHFMSLKVGGRL